MNTTEKQNLVEALSSAKGIAWDTCHKIYVLMDDSQVELMREYGYGDDMVYSAGVSHEALLNTLEDWYANSCDLRVINAVSTVEGDSKFVTIIGQDF